MNLEDFIDKQGQRRVEQAVAQAERATSGEVCVHVTPNCRGDVMKRAVRTFNKLGLYQTKQRNGVLIFVAYQSRKIAILGDVGINEKVPMGFWDNQIATLAKTLAAGQTVEGLCQVVSEVGQRLSTYFPPLADDENELPNEITYDNDEN